MEAVELIRFRVNSASVPLFLERRAAVDAVLKNLPGYIGAELIQVSSDNWLSVIRWASREAVLEAQKTTLTLQIITDWSNLADEFVSFDTADVRYAFRTLQT